MLNEDNIVTLLGSDEFKNAVEEGVALNSETVTSCKSRDKDNFERFYELMLDSDEEIYTIEINSFYITFERKWAIM